MSGRPPALYPWGPLVVRGVCGVAWGGGIDRIATAGVSVGKPQSANRAAGMTNFRLVRKGTALEFEASPYLAEAGPGKVDLNGVFLFVTMYGRMSPHRDIRAWQLKPRRRHSMQFARAARMFDFPPPPPNTTQYATQVPDMR